MSSSTLLILLGAVLGGGLLSIVAGLRRRQPRLSDLVTAYEPAGEQLIAPVSRRHLQARVGAIGAFFDRLGRRLGRPLIRQEDLAITGRRLENQLAITAVGALCGGGIGLALSFLAGSVLPLHSPILTLALPIAGVALGAWLPSRGLQEKATAERDRFLRGFGCWLELVALAQAGGMGIEGAMRASYSVSDDPSFRRLGAALEHARIGAITPWESLRHLGDEIGVPPLVELAATLSLAGTEGARVRSSLIAKSESLRQRAISDAEAKANSTTERLFLPSIILMFAFLIFLMFPAGVRLTGVL